MWCLQQSFFNTNPFYKNIFIQLYLPQHPVTWFAKWSNFIWSSKTGLWTPLIITSSSSSSSIHLFKVLWFQNSRWLFSSLKTFGGEHIIRIVLRISKSYTANREWKLLRRSRYNQWNNSKYIYTYQRILLFLTGNVFIGEGSVAPSPTQSWANKTVPRIPSMEISTSWS